MFNPNARWDRPLPREDTLPGENVDIVVSFKQGGFFPLWFFINSRKHIIKDVHLKWQDKKGLEVFQLFSVSDTNNSRYTLCFSQQRMKWKIIEEE
ncbi:MAG: hypothetical protein KKD05_06770 [Candidatus Omnitrophica bacterium]|nr:hypothetical protein [Candidatus Omnitrophota bacterium]